MREIDYIYYIIIFFFIILLLYLLYYDYIYYITIIILVKYDLHFMRAWFLRFSEQNIDLANASSYVASEQFTRPIAETLGGHRGDDTHRKREKRLRSRLLREEIMKR